MKRKSHALTRAAFAKEVMPKAPVIRFRSRTQNQDIIRMTRLLTNHLMYEL